MSSRFKRQRLTGGLLLVLIPESIHGRLPFLWNPARKERTTVDAKNPAPLMMYKYTSFKTVRSSQVTRGAQFFPSTVYEQDD